MLPYGTQLLTLFRYEIAITHQVQGQLAHFEQHDAGVCVELGVELLVCVEDVLADGVGLLEPGMRKITENVT